MNILENLNERFEIVDEEVCRGGEETVMKVMETSPVPLPKDYIEFLKDISGCADNENEEEATGIELEVENGGSGWSIWLFSARKTLETYEEYKVYSAPVYDDIIDKIWIIGNDLGDLLYFYGEGRDGFGLYVADAGALIMEDADKIADTLTDFLVKGTGIDTAFFN